MKARECTWDMNYDECNLTHSKESTEAVFTQQVLLLHKYSKREKTIKIQCKCIINILSICIRKVVRIKFLYIILVMTFLNIIHEIQTLFNRIINSNNNLIKMIIDYMNSFKLRKIIL